MGPWSYMTNAERGMRSAEGPEERKKRSTPNLCRELCRELCRLPPMRRKREQGGDCRPQLVRRSFPAEADDPTRRRSRLLKRSVSPEPVEGRISDWGFRIADCGRGEKDRTSEFGRWSGCRRSSFRVPRSPVMPISSANGAAFGSLGEPSRGDFGVLFSAFQPMVTYVTPRSNGAGDSHDFGLGISDCARLRPELEATRDYAVATPNPPSQSLRRD